MARDDGTPSWMLALFGFPAVSGVLLLNAGARPAGFLLVALAVAVFMAFVLSSRGKTADDVGD